VYRVSGLGELFYQHCQVPNLSHTLHSKELTKERETSTRQVVITQKGRAFIQKLKGAIDGILELAIQDKQRVDTIHIKSPPAVKIFLILIIRILDAPAMIKTHDPAVKQQLIKTKYVHQKQTQSSTPGEVPAIEKIHPWILAFLTYILRFRREGGVYKRYFWASASLETCAPGGLYFVYSVFLGVTLAWSMQSPESLFFDLQQLY
jgi:hypothetical protein